MKRSIVVLSVVGLLAAVMLSHEAIGAKKKPAKKKKSVGHTTAEVLIAPVQTQSAEVLTAPMQTEPADILIIGHVITVAPEAVAGHLAHGDPLDFHDIDSESPWQGLTWRQLAELHGLDTEGATFAAIRGQ